ncbi:MAG: acetoin utilization protein [Candidatus Hydrogenedentota bacterium]
MTKSAFILCESCMAHDAGRGHQERPGRIEAIRSAFDHAGLNPPHIAPVQASREDLLRVHTVDHVDTIERTCREELEYPDPDTQMVRASWDAALTAAGSAIAACEAVYDGTYRNAFAAVRPPGHHAERTYAKGFCLFNNVLVAARWLQETKGVGKIAILDWDVHHGNGTQHSTYDDDSIYYASIHQYPLYPGTGMPGERGKNNTNLNVHMPWGSGHFEWMDALTDQILPEFERFKPEFLLISCGFDAHRLDPLASQRLESESFSDMTNAVKQLAGGRVVSILEGGYHLDALGESAVAHFNALSA